MSKIDFSKTSLPYCICQASFVCVRLLVVWLTL